MKSARQRSYQRIKRLISELEESVAKSGASGFGDGNDHTVEHLHCIHLTSETENGDDDLITKSYDFMTLHFGDEAETYNWFVYSIKYCAYDYLVLCDQKNQVVGFSSSQYLRVRQHRIRRDHQSILAIWYVAVDPRYRNRGLAKALYSEMYKRTLSLARSRHHEIFAIIGEAVDSAEGFLNAMGRKRLYQTVGGTIEEVSYEYPPMDLDSKTGEVIGKTGIEHLMLRFLDDRNVTSMEDILPIIETIYYEYLGKTKNYVSYRAYSNAKRHIMKMKSDFADRIAASGGSIILRARNEITE